MKRFTALLFADDETLVESTNLTQVEVDRNGGEGVAPELGRRWNGRNHETESRGEVIDK